MAKIISFDYERHVLRVKTEIAALDKNLLEGGCSDFSAYRAKVGERKGLIRALDLLKTSVNAGDDDNDE